MYRPRSGRSRTCSTRLVPSSTTARTDPARQTGTARTYGGRARHESHATERHAPTKKRLGLKGMCLSISPATSEPRISTTLVSAVIVPAVSSSALCVLALAGGHCVGVPDKSCGISNDNSEWRHIASDDSARPDHGICTDRETWEKRGVCADGAPRCTTVDSKLAGHTRLRGNLSLVNVAFGPDEDVIFEPDPIPKLNPALDRYSISDDNIVLDEDTITHVAVGTKHRAGKDVSEVPRCAFHRQSAEIRRSRFGERTTPILPPIIPVAQERQRPVRPRRR